MAAQLPEEEKAAARSDYVYENTGGLEISTAGSAE